MADIGEQRVSGSSHSAFKPRKANSNLLRVVIFTPFGEGGRGGIDTLMDELRREFNSNRHGIVKPCFITTRGHGSILLSPFFFFVALLRLLILKLLNRVDVAHINLSADGSTYRKFILAHFARLCYVPYVIHLHSGNFDIFWDSCEGLLRTEIDNMFLYCQKIIVTGKYWEKVVLDRCPTCTGKVTILYNATRSVIYDHPKNTKDINILFLGRHGPEKGVPQLVSALSHLPSNIRWTATLAGNGATENTRAEIRRAGLIDRVTVPGWVGLKEHDALLRAATIFVLPSLSENLPMSVIEALAYGIAVICTPVGALPEIIEHEKTGLLVQPGDVVGLTDALLRLIKDPELRRRLGSNAKAEHTEILEIGRFAERLVTIWTEAITIDVGPKGGTNRTDFLIANATNPSS